MRACVDCSKQTDRARRAPDPFRRCARTQVRLGTALPLLAFEAFIFCSMQLQAAARDGAAAEAARRYAGAGLAAPLVLQFAIELHLRCRYAAAQGMSDGELGAWRLPVRAARAAAAAARGAAAVVERGLQQQTLLFGAVSVGVGALLSSLATSYSQHLAAAPQS